MDPASRPTAAERSARRLAEAVRRACLTAAMDAYEQAGTSGMCAEGRWELAVDAVRSLDVEALVHDVAGEDGPAPG